MMTRIAVIGDIHGAWNARDVEYFNAAGYDLVLFVGDLSWLTGAVKVARRISRLDVPALLIPGNHDGCTPLQLLAEMHHREKAARRLSRGQAQRVQAIEEALGPVTLAGYSLHRCGAVSVIAGRPHAMGGDRLYFADYLRWRFGVDSLAASAERLRQLVDQSEAQIVFLAHNGPSGLGDAPDSIWGCDFDPERGDFGDPDLREAIAYARASGRRVRAVVAGHMHHQVEGGGCRPWYRVQGGTLYLNAARVPRAERADGGMRRYHLRLELDAHETRASEIWVADDLSETPGDSVAL